MRKILSLITLTSRNKDRKIFIDYQDISYFHCKEEEGYTNLSVKGSRHLLEVQETAEEIYELIKKAEVAMLEYYTPQALPIPKF